MLRSFCVARTTLALVRDSSAGPAVLKEASHGDGKISAYAIANDAFKFGKTRDRRRSGRLLRNPDEPHGAGGDTLDRMSLCADRDATRPRAA